MEHRSQPDREPASNPAADPAVDPAAATPFRLAVIDVGTNSTRLVVAESRPDGGYSILDDEKVVTRLGSGMARTGGLSEEAMEETARAIATLRTIADAHDVRAIHAVATCAVREATNGARFAALVNEVAHLTLHTISSEEEGRLAFRSVAQAFDLRDQRVAVADIGGGSTEVVLASGSIVEQIYALPLGAVRLTEMFDLAAEIQPRAYRKMRRYIDKVIEEKIGRPTMQVQLVIGTGGTFTTMAQVERLGLRPTAADDDRGRSSVRGFEMQHASVRHLVEGLRKMPIAERARVKGLPPDRVDIIVAGLSIIDRLLHHLGANTVRVHDQGIRTGYLLNMLETYGATPADAGSGRPPERLEVVRRFAKDCNASSPHAEHVRWLALRLFDELGGLLPESGTSWYTESSRSLLEAAAVLHEVGYFINYRKHHHHAYHLIMHADLPGFDHAELELIANIARYHRRARPRKKHLNFKALSPPNRTLVRELASILRLATGLDRGRDQKVHDLHMAMDGRRLVLNVEADEQPVVDLWGAERKSDLFERVFERSVEVVWTGDDPQE